MGCEALCTRICIMVAGQLKCIGSGQHLKARFGRSFTMEIALELPSEEQKQALQQNIFQLINNTSMPPLMGSPRSPRSPTKEEVELTEVTTTDKQPMEFADPAVAPKVVVYAQKSRPKIKHSKSRALLQNTSLAPLFQGNAEGMDRMPQQLNVQTRFPWFHASFVNTPYGGLERNMTARDAGIFMVERERVLCLKGFMQQHFPDAVLKEEFGNTLRYQTPNIDASGLRRELA